MIESSNKSKLHINYRYLLQRADNLRSEKGDIRILDFGCGRAEVVIEARRRGINAYGADVFHGATSSRKELIARHGLLGDVVKEIKDGIIGYESESFDLVVSNMVFEHVVGIDSALNEIYRVMKKGSLFISLFPTKEVIREGHFGIPFLHWFSRGSKIRYLYTLVLRSLGLGLDNGIKSSFEWTNKALNYIDNKTAYRKQKDIMSCFSKYFETTMIEDDYIKFRLSETIKGRWPNAVLKIFFVKMLACWVFRRLACTVIIARKPCQA